MRHPTLKLLAAVSPLLLASCNTGANSGASAASTSPKGPPMFASQGKKITIPQGFIIGADISAVPAAEDRGTVFMDKGQPMDVLAILKSHGFNYIRLRVFVDPKAPGGYSAQGYCDLEHTIAMAKRIKAAGMGFLLDFHYSDTWADPGKQTKPLAWRELTLPELVQKVHDYTQDAVAQLKAAGATPDMVQVGNEITPGLLLNRLPGGRGGAAARDVSTQPEGSASQWDNLAALLKAGIAGVKDADPKILIVLHIDLGGNNAKTRTWVDNALARGVQFDILAESCYTQANWQGPNAKHKANFDDLVTRYPNLYFLNVEYGGGPRDENNNLIDTRNGEITQVKPAYARDGVDWTKREANAIMHSLPDKRGLGTFIWEPTQNGNLQALFTQGVANTELYEYDAMAKEYGAKQAGN